MSEGLSYIDTHDVDGVKFGLENILELLESLDNPQKKLKAIHIRCYYLLIMCCCLLKLDMMILYKEMRK